MRYFMSWEFKWLVQPCLMFLVSCLIVEILSFCPISNWLSLCFTLSELSIELGGLSRSGVIVGFLEEPVTAQELSPCQQAHRPSLTMEWLFSCSVVSDFPWPHGLQHTRLKEQMASAERVRGQADPTRCRWSDHILRGCGGHQADGLWF